MENDKTNIGTPISADLFQDLCCRTIQQSLLPYQKEEHALCGMMSELGEVMSLYQHIYQGEMLDYDKLKDELGDMLWFVCELLTVNNIRLSEVMWRNVEKLKERYPDGFDAERSVRRHDDE